MQSDAIAGTHVPKVAFDPFDPARIANLHQTQDHIRDLGPVVWIAAHSTYGAARYESVHTVLNNWAQFTSAGGVGMPDIRKPGAWRDPDFIVDTDPPRHTTIRSAMNRIFSPKTVKSLQDKLQNKADELCEKVLSQDSFDAVHELTEAYILSVFPQLLGVEVHRENLLIVGHHTFNALGPENALFRKSEEEVASIMEWFLKFQRADNIAPGGLSELIFKAETDGDLPQGVASPMMRTLLRGGMDTTIAGIGTALLNLAKSPEQYALVRENPALVRQAFEEALRLESPIQTFYRTTVGEVDLCGVTLAADTKLQLFIGAANRDPRRWENPDRFDLTRKVIGHVALGNGIHVCLGQMIARLEAECLLTAFVHRVAKVEVTGDTPYRMSNGLRTPDRIPVRIVRA